MLPRLSDDQPTWFPAPETALPGGELAVGSTLRPDRILAAYAQGIFPWKVENGDLTWYSPDPRFVISRDSFHLSSNLKRRMRRGDFELRFDTAFDQVIAGCAADRSPERPGTWISEGVREAFSALHRQGRVHSLESWQNGELVGGAYGLALGKVFFAESMFKRVAEASKVAFAALGSTLFERGFELIDCQIESVHMASFGGQNWPRARFLQTLRELTVDPGPMGTWTDWKPAAHPAPGVPA